jgi:hypothetical protein
VSGFEAGGRRYRFIEHAAENHKSRPAGSFSRTLRELFQRAEQTPR